MSSYDGTLKILLLGDASVGKTSFIKRFCYNLFNPSERLTIGVDFHVKTIDLQGKKIKLQIWGVGGEERFRFLLPTYCLRANAVIIVFDVTRSQTLDNIEQWINIVRQKSGDIPIMLVGLLPDEKSEQEVSAEEGKKIAKSRNLSGYFECNPKTGVNVEKVFEAIARLILAGIGSQRGKREKVKDEAKDEEYLITYTRHLEKKVRNLETENSTLENQIKQVRLEKQLRIKQDLDDLHNEIDKYKKMGI